MPVSLAAPQMSNDKTTKTLQTAGMLAIFQLCCGRAHCRFKNSYVVTIVVPCTKVASQQQNLKHDLHDLFPIIGSSAIVLKDSYLCKNAGPRASEAPTTPLIDNIGGVPYPQSHVHEPGGHPFPQASHSLLLDQSSANCEKRRSLRPELPFCYLWPTSTTISGMKFQYAIMSPRMMAPHSRAHHPWPQPTDVPKDCHI